MRTATFITIMFVAFGYATTAQKLTLLPQAGIENSRTTVQYNDLPSFLPAGGVLAPYLGVRMDYRCKQGHGLFVGIGTSRSVVSYNFDDLQTGMHTYSASAADMKLRFEGGYQFSTKRMYFNKSGSTAKSPKIQQSNVLKKDCGNYSATHYCRKSADKALLANTKNKGWYMSIQPSLGAVLASPVKPGISTSALSSQTTYSYKAGNWNTALITGAGFEFGKNTQSIFTISINYLRGLGNLGTKTVTSTSDNKTITASLKSATSSWTITAGIPITLTKGKAAVKQNSVEKSSRPRGNCGYYKHRCMRMN